MNLIGRIWPVLSFFSLFSLFLGSCASHFQSPESTFGSHERFSLPAAVMNVSNTSQPLVMATSCGNLSLATEEECDDGNRQAGDGCNASCLIEEGWSCSEDEPSLCEPLCGDGLKLASEACDDGNTDNGDGCSQSCQSDAFVALR